MSDSIHRTLQTVAAELRAVNGVSAIVLGGSRARDSHTASSDIDIGIYYENGALDMSALQAVAQRLDDAHRADVVTPIGAWGKWINGGGWLRVNGIAVDLLYRDLARVREVVANCCDGKISIDYQPGHPHGFVSSIYAGEVAVCVALHDPFASIAALKQRVLPYPPALREATIRAFAWEIDFALQTAKKGAARGDTSYVAGCLFRAVACINQALFALNGAYLLNEKGATSIAAQFAKTPRDYQQRVASGFALSADAATLMRAIAEIESLAAEVMRWVRATNEVDE